MKREIWSHFFAFVSHRTMDGFIGGIVFCR